MTFDLSRVFTAVNADKLKHGDKVICADTLEALKRRVDQNEGVEELQTVNCEDWERRFGFRMHNSSLAYLVEEAENCTNCGARWVCPMGVPKEPKLTRCDAYEPIQKENKWRPFKNKDELCKVWEQKQRCKGDHIIPTPLEMPFIWVQRIDKSTGESQHLITSFNVPILRNEQWTNGVSVEGTSITLEALFRCYEFLDGTPCGVEE